MSPRDAALPLENFIQAVQSQLDNAQSAMAVKARNLNLPLTFAIKDITLDLRAQVEFAAGEVRIRPAAAGDGAASVLHLVFTAITRPMIEENAITLAENPAETSLDEVDAALTEEERRKLEWVGVRTVEKLQDLEDSGSARQIGRVTNLPLDRLRHALQRASAPLVDQVVSVSPRPGDPAGSPALIRLRGKNLAKGGAPRVTLDGRPVSVVRAAGDEILLAPRPDQWTGELRVEGAGGQAAALAFDLSSHAPSAHSPGDAP